MMENTQKQIQEDQTGLSEVDGFDKTRLENDILESSDKLDIINFYITKYIT